jgi:ATP-dependent DNA ligase
LGGQNRKSWPANSTSALPPKADVGTNDEIQLYAFDILALDGDDLRKLPLHLRKTNLAHLLARRADGIHLAPFEQGEIGPDLFKAACDMMLEGLVSSDGTAAIGPAHRATGSRS